MAGKEKFKITIPREEKNIFQKSLSVWKNIWGFLRKDSFLSLVVDFILAFLIIKFIFFPLLSIATGTALPLVIVESCSMYHSDGLEEVLQNPIYASNGVTLNDAEDWSFKNGMNKGDIIFVINPKNAEIGNVVIFNGGVAHPIIHRIIAETNTKISTKGDHNIGQLSIEQDINKERLIGKAVFRIPYIGWLKLIFFEFSRSPEEKGLCN